VLKTKSEVVFLLIKFAFQEFIEDRRFKNLSEKTLKGYELCFKKFGEYLTRKEIINAEDITTAVIKGYLLELKEERGNNPTSINTKLKNLKAFFNYLEEEGIIKNNPTSRIKYIKEDVKIEVFSDEQIFQMLNYYRRLISRQKEFYAFRDYIIIITLLGTGMRLGELVNLKWSDVNFDGYSIIVYGKQREYSSIPMNEKLKKELREYNIYCKQLFIDVPLYVFSDKKGKQLSDNAVKNVFKRLKYKMNFIDVRLSAHTFRHTFAHRALMAGMDVFTLQKILRHKKLSMTEKYLALWGTALKEQNDKYNPLNNINI